LNTNPIIGLSDKGSNVGVGVGLGAGVGVGKMVTTTGIIVGIRVGSAVSTGVADTSVALACNEGGGIKDRLLRNSVNPNPMMSNSITMTELLKKSLIFCNNFSSC
jgi:hypothetical protein